MTPILTNHLRQRFEERYPDLDLAETVAASVSLFSDKWIDRAKETCVKPEHRYDYDRGLLRLYGIPSKGIAFVWRQGLFVTVLDLSD